MTPERRDEIALRVVSVVVVGSLALALAGLTWRLTGWDDGRDEVAVAERLAPPGGAAAPGADADVVRIVSLAPFGGATAPGGLPASTLGLVLKGVLMASPPSASTALISVGDGPAAIYGIGQTPVGDAVIETSGRKPRADTSPCPHDSGGPYFRERADGTASAFQAPAR